MKWQHYNTKKVLIRPCDSIIKLRHKNAMTHFSQVVHIPQHAMCSLRPQQPTAWARISILFNKTQAVELPEDMANYLLERFPEVIYVVNGVDKQPENVYHTTEEYSKMSWNALRKAAALKGVYHPEDTREVLISKLMGT